MDNSRYKLSLLTSAVAMISDFIPNLISTNPSYGVNRRGKRQRIKYRPDQRTFTKIRPEVQSRWAAVPETARERFLS